MRLKKICTLFITASAGLVLSACLGDEPPAETLLSSRAASIEIMIGELSPREMEADTCGLFLWAQVATPALVFFADNANPAAAMNLRGEEVQLPRTSARGEVILGHFTEQRFEGRDLAVSLSLRVDKDAGILRGAKVSSGILRLEEQDGRQIVMPVAGLIACDR